MQGNSYIHSIAPSIPYNSTQQADIAVSNAMNGLFVIALPVIVICAIAVHSQYRAMVLRQHIKRLNRLWQLDSSNKLS